MSEKEDIEYKGIAEVDTNELTQNATTHSENTHKHRLNCGLSKTFK
jgi:hypothetical protein